MAEKPLEVLVVEDNPGDIQLIKTGFEKSGVAHSITHVSDGKEALDYLYQRNGYESNGNPDLTVLDLNAPKLTGQDVLERMNGESDLSSIPVVVLTGSQADNHIHETYQLGADGYFVKPVDPHEFMSLVKRVANSIAASGTLPSGKYADLDQGE